MFHKSINCRLRFSLVRVIACALFLMPFGAMALESDDYLLSTESIGDAVTGLSGSDTYDSFARLDAFNRSGVSEDFIIVPIYLDGRATSSVASSSVTNSSASSVSEASSETLDGGGGGLRRIYSSESFHFAAPKQSSSRRRIRPPTGQIAVPLSSASSALSVMQGTSDERSAEAIASVSSASSSSGGVPIVRSVSEACQRISLLALLLAFMGGALITYARVAKRLQRRRRKWLRLLVLLLGIACTLASIGPPLVEYVVPQAQAAVTVPQKHVYNGHLLTKDGLPATGTFSIRFSQWRSEDKVDGDTLPDGSINASAPQFTAWSEVHAVTPDARGFFSVVLGEQVPLPASSDIDLFLQVDVKPAAALDTSYQMLDVNTADTAKDRSPILSLPFTRNADLLDFHDIGTGSGAIPLLGSGGKLPVGMMPGATESGAFIIDADDTETERIDLQFGSDLAKKLSYDLLNNRFTFNDSVRIEGDLTVTGLINGIDLNDLQSGTGARTEQITLHPQFPNASYQADGSNNVGQLVIDFDDEAKKNAYLWTSSRTALQDYAIQVKVRLPANFSRWAEEPVQVEYRSATANAAENALSVAMFDTANQAVSLTGTASDLTSVSWAATNLGFSGAPVWTPDGDVLFVFMLAAMDGTQMRLGSVTLRYVSFEN